MENDQRRASPRGLLAASLARDPASLLLCPLAMALHLTLTYESGSDLRSHLMDPESRGALLVPLAGPLPEVGQYERLTLQVCVGEVGGLVEAEVLQVIPDNGIAIQILDMGDVELLAASFADQPDRLGPARPPRVEMAWASGAADGGPGGDAEVPDGQDGDRDTGTEWDRDEGGDLARGDEANGPLEDDAGGSGRPRLGGAVPGAPAGSSPVSWSIEQLRAHWDELPTPDRVRVARYGRRPARAMILRGIDKSLHIHLLRNPKLTTEEVAQMAGMPGLEPAVLKRIASGVEYRKVPSIARALVCNPKLALPLVKRVIPSVPRDELSRLARTGKVRAPVKEAIVRYLDKLR